MYLWYDLSATQRFPLWKKRACIFNPEKEAIYLHFYCKTMTNVIYKCDWDHIYIFLRGDNFVPLRILS
jgi:hypothetical protein